MKKTFVILMCAVLVVSSAALGTIAYLTDRQGVVNEFTVGNVQIEVDESDVYEEGDDIPEGSEVGDPKPNPDYDPNDPESGDENLRTDEGNTYPMVPAAEYVKDPTMTVKAGSQESYVRMVVTLTKATALKEIFADLQAKYPADFANGFLPEEHTDGTWNSEKWPCFSMTEDTENDTFVLEYRYPETVTPTQDADLELEPLFEKIVIPGQLNNDHLEKLEGFTIDVQGHAIQSLGFDTADEAWAAFDAQTEAESGVVTP